MAPATEFTPLAALLGGALIGLSAVVLMAANGRIAGISGIAGGIVGAPPGERGWRIAFLAGLIPAPLLLALVSGEAPQVEIAAGPWTLIAAGVLVGFGTQLGSGCTSGHGVCGVSRLSTRSIAATAIFMLAGGLVVFAARHVL